MPWSAVGGTHLVSGADLRMAVNESIAFLKTGQTIPNDDVVLNRSEVEQYVHVTVNNTPASNQCPSKNDLSFTSQFSCSSNSFTYNGLNSSGSESCGYARYYYVDVGSTSGLVTLSFSNFDNFPSGGITLAITYNDGTSIVSTTFTQASTYQFNYTYNASKGTVIRIQFGYSCP